ncbi:hypothetical protein C0Q70_16629 [Pomacea canaliculata]|uniref:PHD-type domain-containing protein n=1 Tax=Pomacea canaliculata TaxID=400727 RepID=A0A2T7NQB5_POMCA|nr:hypothetical protein C0Q70_16629 [Pomacea canaliculata]
MGGSPSKEKKNNKFQQNSKGGKKNKRKLNKKAATKTDAKWTKVSGEGVKLQHDDRKDSDVEDLKNPPQRERSKSLRFCDFTQLERTPKVGHADLLPVDIAFFQEGRVQPEELCHICSVYTGSETMTCGVCYRTYHESCLSKIGQWCDSHKSEPGTLWTCHQCANLGNLLTEEEIINVLRRLDKCGIRREDDLTLADYMAYCHLSLQEDEGKILTREKAENARRRFAQVDTAHSGRITWCQFLNIESVRILNKRPKNSLVRLLTSPELERARDAFRLLDTDMCGRITKATAHEALDRNSRRSGYYPDETMMYIDDDLSDHPECQSLTCSSSQKQFAESCVCGGQPEFVKQANVTSDL